MKPALALIILGGLLMIGAVAAGVITEELQKERVADFYRQHSNTANLPSEMRSSSAPIEVIGFLAGSAMVIAGIWLSRPPRAPSGPPAPH